MHTTGTYCVLCVNYINSPPKLRILSAENLYPWFTEWDTQFVHSFPKEGDFNVLSCFMFQFSPKIICKIGDIFNFVTKRIHSFVTRWKSSQI